MGRTEFRTWNDCERALVGYGTSSTRAKWRAPRSARVSMLEKNLTAPTLLEMAFCDSWDVEKSDAKRKPRLTKRVSGHSETPAVGAGIFLPNTI